MIPPVLPGDPTVCTCDRPITPPELWPRCQPTSNNSTCVHTVCMRVWVKRHWMQHLCMRHNFPWEPVHNYMHSCQHMRALGHLQCSPVFFSCPCLLNKTLKLSVFVWPLSSFLQIHHAQPCPLPSRLQTRSVFPGHDLFTLNAFQSH